MLRFRMKNEGKKFEVERGKSRVSTRRQPAASQREILPTKVEYREKNGSRKFFVIQHYEPRLKPSSETWANRKKTSSPLAEVGCRIELEDVKREGRLSRLDPKGLFLREDWLLFVNNLWLSFKNQSRFLSFKTKQPCRTSLHHLLVLQSWPHQHSHHHHQAHLVMSDVKTSALPTSTPMTKRSVSFGPSSTEPGNNSNSNSNSTSNTPKSALKPGREKTNLPPPEQYQHTDPLLRRLRLVDSNGKPLDLKKQFGSDTKVVGFYFSSQWAGQPLKEYHKVRLANT